MCEEPSVKVPFVNLPARYERYTKNFHAALDRVLEHGQVILGKEVSAFEENLAAFIGCKHVVSVGNGTDALVLALKSSGIGAGDEVITTPVSYLASTSAIVLSGATPVFVDVGDDLNIDPEQVEQVITPATKAILAVHVGGNPANCQKLENLSEAYGLKLIEDCAQAIGARFLGRCVGTFGAAGAVSFHPLKNLGALGDAGAIFTDDDDMAAWLRVARNHGHSSRDQCEFWSVNSRLDAIQAAFLNVMLTELPAVLTARREQAKAYKGVLNDILEFPTVHDGAAPTYNMMMAMVNDRDHLMRELNKYGIETKIHYPIPIHQLKAAENLPGVQKILINAERFSKRILSLPLGDHLSAEQIEFVTDKICSVI